MTKRVICITFFYNLVYFVRHILVKKRIFPICTSFRFDVKTDVFYVIDNLFYLNVRR